MLEERLNWGAEFALDALASSSQEALVGGAGPRKLHPVASAKSKYATQ